MPQFIVHAGLAKTATTTIQTALYENHEELLKHGVLYPSVAKVHTLQLTSMFRQRPVNHCLLRDKSDVELDHYALESRSAFETQFSIPDLQQIIISSEGLMNFKQKDFEKLHQWTTNWSHDVKVVVYLRDPIKHTISCIQQVIKGESSFDEIIAKLPNFIVKLDRLLAILFKVFGKDNVIIREFEATIDKDFGILGDFFEMINVPQDVKARIVASTQRMNESLSLEAVLLLIHAERAGKKVNLRFARKITGSKFDLPLPLKHLIFEMTRPSVEFIENEIGIDRYSYARETITSSVKQSDFDSNGIFNVLDAFISSGFDNPRFIFSAK